MQQLVWSTWALLMFISLIMCGHFRCMEPKLKLNLVGLSHDSRTISHDFLSFSFLSFSFSDLHERCVLSASLSILKVASPFLSAQPAPANSWNGHEPAHELNFVMNFVCCMVHELKVMAGQPEWTFMDFQTVHSGLLFPDRLSLLNLNVYQPSKQRGRTYKGAFRSSPLRLWSL